MAQWVKMLAFKTGSLSAIPRTHMEDGEGMEMNDDPTRLVLVTFCIAGTKCLTRVT